MFKTYLYSPRGYFLYTYPDNGEKVPKQGSSIHEERRVTRIV
jgi:hypothetical protein